MGVKVCEKQVMKTAVGSKLQQAFAGQNVHQDVVYNQLSEFWESKPHLDMKIVIFFKYIIYCWIIVLPVL